MAGPSTCPAASNWVSDGTPSPFPMLQSAPSMAFRPGHYAKNPYGFSDYSVGHTLALGQEAMSWQHRGDTWRALAEPLASNGFTRQRSIRAAISAPARVWAWKATKRCNRRGLSNGRSAPPRSTAIAPSTTAAASRIQRCRTSRTPVRSSMSMACSACRIGSTPPQATLGYRADYFKSSSASKCIAGDGGQRNRVNLGPMIRFSIQK